MSKITLDNLSDNLKDYLDKLGITEEQVLEIIRSVVGSLNDLTTDNKINIVEAINELNSQIGSASVDVSEIYNSMIDKL